MIAQYDRVASLLASPDSRLPLTRIDERCVSDGVNQYPIWGGKPVLLPHMLLQYFSEGGWNIPYELKSSPVYQYFLLSQIKATSGPVNDLPDDPWNLKHLEWSRDLLADARGLTLDIGCDDVELSASLLPAGAEYVGLDPVYRANGNFAVVGVGEFLPFLSETFDSAIFLTSLDHILDWHQSVEEAFRVLRPGGTLYVSSLIWHARAGLLRDTVHFRHFREYELTGGFASAGFVTGSAQYYPWKGDAHRRVIQFKAVKPVVR